MRKIRDGLGLLGLDADELLLHGSPQLVYGVKLVRKLQEYLLGIDSRPLYLFRRRGSAGFSAHIARW